MRERSAQGTRVRCTKKLGTVILSVALFACGQSNGSRPQRSVSFEPSFLNFEGVSVRGQRAMALLMTPHGDDFDITNISTTSGKFRFSVSDSIRGGLANGETGLIEVLYRPCPEAWSGENLIPDFDFSLCNRREDEGRIRIVDGRNGWAGEVALLGKPAEPGVLRVTCEVAQGDCAQAKVVSSPSCSGIDFGSLTKDESCQIEVRFENAADVDSAYASVRSLQVWVAGDETAERISGDAVGITGFQNQSFDLAPGESRTVALKFKPEATGTWETTANTDLGFHIFTEESAISPAWRIDVKASSAAPRLEVYPSILTWQKAETDSPRTTEVTLSNSGNAPLVIENASIASDNNALDFPEVNRVTIEPGDSFSLDVTYLGSETIFSTELLLESSDPNQPVFSIPVSIEPTPKLCVDPGRMLEINDEVGDIRLTNCGDGILTISDLKLEHSEASSAYNSIEDFIIEGCPGNDCQPDLRLCSSQDPGCPVSSIVFHVVYENRDNSPFDIVDFVVTTNDQNSPEQRVSVKGLTL